MNYNMQGMMKMILELFPMLKSMMVEIMKEHEVLISMLLEMDSLVMIITLMCLACIPAGTREKPLPWVGMSLSPVSVGTVMSGMAW